MRKLGMRLALTGVMLLLLVITAANVCLSDDDFNPPGVPTPVPVSGGGSGGGSSSSHSSGVSTVFQAYTHDLKSSDGTVIGQFQGKNYNSVLVSASRNATVDGVTYALSVAGELSSEPSGTVWMDIVFPGNGGAQVPIGMEDGLMLAVINVTKSPSGWSYKSGSPTYTFTVTGLNASLNAVDPYYLVRSDGTGFQVQTITPEVSGGNVTVKLSPSSDTGVYTIMRAPVATPTPTPTPTPEPTVVPTATPEPGNMWSFPILIAMFAVGAIAGAAAIFLLNRAK